MSDSGDTASAERDELVAELVERALEELDHGRNPDLVALCGARANLAGAVREGLAIARSLGQLGRLADDPFAGTVLGERYHVAERIGAGAMGAVYRARDRELGREVAIKLLQPGLFPSPAAQARFLREAELCAALEHPHVVRVYDRGRTPGGILFLVMELVRGASLAAIAAAAEAEFAVGPDRRLRRLDDWIDAFLDVRPDASWIRLAAHWSRQIAEALAAGHAAGVHHRDVKPSNVLVDRGGRAMLVDFGIAARTTDPAWTATGTTLGTPWYLPPERATGRATPDARQDVYSLGATLHHLVSGHPPFDGEAAEVLGCLRTDLPRPASAYVRGLPRDLQAILDRALEFDPRRRYADAGELADDLTAFLDHRPTRARPLSRLRRGARAFRRRPAPILAVVAGATVITLFGVLDRLSSRDADARARAELAEQARLRTRIPALLTIEGVPDQRPVGDAGSIALDAARLDAILALGQDLEARLLRASMRLDSADFDGAAADVATLARDWPSPYLAAVADRYAAAERERRGILALDRTVLPPRATPVDRYVAALHAVRARALDELPELERELDEVGDSLVEARDLRALVLLMLGDYERDDRARREGYLHAAYDEALHVASLRGKTARTQHVLGAALVALRRHADAIVPLREAVELQPERHGPLQNLGTALLGAGRLEEARTVLEAAHRLRPEMWNTMHSLARVFCALDDLDTAERFAISITDEVAPGARWMRPYLLGHIALQRAFDALRRDDLGGARRAADAAVVLYEETAANGQPGRGAAAAAYARAIVADDRERALLEFLDRLGDEVANPAELVNLAGLIRGDAPLGVAAVGRLRELLVRQAIWFAPGRADYREQLEWLRRPSAGNPRSDGR
ncbi:MAG: protein kinase [Planctomycetes bacterium]|nr:protein kinase [Planctomycetota bacterium]